MAQPCGKVLSFDSRYRIYMRSSPLICITDAISIPTEPSHSEAPAQASLVSVFNNPHPQQIWRRKRRRGLESLEVHDTVALALLILGPLGPGIKMLSMDGIPWSKTWGLMFLVSFSVTELLVVLARKINSLEGLGHTAASQTLDGTRRLLFSAALGFQVLVSIDCTFRLLSFPMPCLLSNPVARVSVILWETLLLSLAVEVFIWMTWGGHWEILLGQLFVAVFAIFAAGICSSYKSAIVDTLILYIIVAFVFLVSRSLAWLSSRASADVVKVLCITKPGNFIYGYRTSDVPDVSDPEGALLLILFPLSLVLCISWYASRYDPTGTFNPPWTSVFG